MVQDFDPRLVDLIFENIPCGIFTVDSNGAITFFNKPAEEITGWSREQVLGRQCSDILGNPLCDRSCFLRSSIDSAETHKDKEVRIERRDGRKLLVSISTAALRNRRGEIIGGVEMFRDVSDIARLRRELKARFTSHDIISKSRAMRSVKELLPMVAQSRSTVLVEGEPGTGKELLARAIHNLSPRASRPFVALNCGALPDNLAESEMFGYKRGAFTGAAGDKPGRFAMAEKGTLFLDEVGELSPAMQVKLLRVLQEGEYMPLGGVATATADVRVIAATNRDLVFEVESGRFRQDLYYRLNVVQVNLPPLRVRDGDIPLLAEHFIQKFNVQQGRRIGDISEEAMAVLVRHAFPGNVRELENAIEHAFVVCAGNVIQAADLPTLMRSGHEAVPVPAHGAVDRSAAALVSDAEIQAIRDALTRCAGNRTAAARELGLSRSTLWRKMKRYDIDGSGSRGPNRL